MKPKPDIEPGAVFFDANRVGKSAQIVQADMATRKSQGPSWYPQNAGAFRLPHSPAPPFRAANLGPFGLPSPSLTPFKNVKETKVSIDQVIEELRAELRNAVYRGELREIKAAPELAFAKRETIWAEQETIMMAEPAFWEAFARNTTSQALSTGQ